MPRWVLGLAAGVLGLLAFGYWWVDHDERTFAAERRTAGNDVTAGRFATARRRLEALNARRPRDGEVLYLLGQCEKSDGRYREAIAYWSRVPNADPFASRAYRLAADELINDGHYSEAARLLDAALDLGGPETYATLKVLNRLYRFEGRYDEVRSLLHRAITLSTNPAPDLKELWLLDNSPMPIEVLTEALAHARDDDPHVWLARANLATLSGRFDEALQWLDKLEGHTGPPTAALRRARLKRATAARDNASLLSALEGISNPAELELDELRQLQVRLLRQVDRVNDAARVLRAIIGHSFGSTWAYEQLAEIETHRGHTDEAKEIQRKKAVIDQAKDAYRKILLDGPQPDRYGELAELARTLGRSFDAKAWELLAQAASSPPELDEALGSFLAESPQAVEEKLRLRRNVLELLISTGPAPDAPRSQQAEPAYTPPAFDDVASRIGLDFTFDNGATSMRLLPETMSGGVGVLDYNGDGWLDVFVIQGGSLYESVSRPRESDRLFRNRGDGTFEDATEKSGIAALPRGYGLGVTVGDIDNDGFPDLFLSRLRSYALWRNRGDGTFEDVTESWGLAGMRDNPTSAAFADLDRDGDLDLYVCHYMKYDPDHPISCQDESGKFFYCDPSKVEAAPDRLFRNDGGRFVDVTDEAGIVDPNGRGLGVVAADLDDDGLTDLYVANDGTANYLFTNRGKMKFEDTALSCGAAGNAEGGYQASMGVACGDVDGDGRPELVVTNFWGECSTLYHNLGGGLFTDHTTPSGVARATRYLLGFGTAFFDYDNDGRLDLVTANGHVNDNQPYYPYAMPPQLLANVGGGRLVDAGATHGGVWTTPLVGRGLAVGDLDNDGRAEVIILPQATPLICLKNETKAGEFLAIRLVGRQSNRDGVGTRVIVRSAGTTQVHERIGGGSYQSASDGRLLIGLGDATQVDSVELQWPSGQVDCFQRLLAGRGYTLVEGESEPRPLPGYCQGD